MEVAMVRVRIHRPIEEKDEAAMLALLSEAGCEVVPDEEPDAPAPIVEDSAATSERCDALIVLLPRDGTADAAFEEAMLAAVQAGRRIIGLWPSDGSGGVPACFDDYGGDTVSWNPDRLRQAAAGAPQHRTADDAVQEAPETERHVCK
jgi:hypothetical protein